MRLACDTGGTFTDLVVEADGELAHVQGVDDARTTRSRACSTRSRWRPTTTAWRSADFLAPGETFIHGTTRAINAILTGKTARTAFLTTEGHPDILVFREGGRIEPFDFTVPYPEPYVPRALTFEIPERIGADGEVVTPLDEAAVRRDRSSGCASSRSRRSASACSGRSSTRPTSCGSASCSPSICRACRSRCRTELNPTLREYRRASSTCIDASLKPLMGDYLRGLDGAAARGGLRRPRADGHLAGRRHGCRRRRRGADPRDQLRPGDGAGRRPPLRRARRRHRHRHRRRHRRHQLRRQPGARRPHPLDARDLARPALPRPHDRLPLGRRARASAPAAARSPGSTRGGLLHVGPAERRRRARARPATAAAAPSRPSPTARCVLGYIDPDVLPRRRDAPRPRGGARPRSARQVAAPLGLRARGGGGRRPRARDREHGAARSRRSPSTRASIRATAVLVGGGGAAGLNAVAIARRLGCRAGAGPRGRRRAQRRRRAHVRPQRRVRARWRSRTQRALRPRRRSTPCSAELERAVPRLHRAAPARARSSSASTTSVEARYPHQIWEIEVPLRVGRVSTATTDVRRAGRRLPRRPTSEIFAVSDPGSEIEIVDLARAGRAAGCATRGRAAWRASAADAEIGGTRARLLRRHRAGSRPTVDRFEAIAAEAHGRRAGDRRIVASPRSSSTPARVATPDRRAAASSITVVSEHAEHAQADPRPADARQRRRAHGDPRQPPRDDRAQDGEHAVPHRRARACSTPRATSPAASSPPTHELLAAAESLPIHVLRRARPHVARDGRSSIPSCGAATPSCTTRPITATRTPPTTRILVPVIDDDGVHRFTVLRQGPPGRLGNSQPTTYIGAARDVYDEGALIFPAVQVQRGLPRHRRHHPHVPAAHPRARAVVGRLPRAARRGPHRRARAAGARRARSAGTRSTRMPRQWFDYSEQRMVGGDPPPAARAGARASASTIRSRARRPRASPIKVTVDVDADGGADRGRPARQSRLPAERPERHRGQRARPRR